MPTLSEKKLAQALGNLLRRCAFSTTGDGDFWRAVDHARRVLQEYHRPTMVCYVSREVKGRTYQGSVHRDGTVDEIMVTYERQQACGPRNKSRCPMVISGPLKRGKLYDQLALSMRCMVLPVTQ